MPASCCYAPPIGTTPARQHQHGYWMNRSLRSETVGMRCPVKRSASIGRLLRLPGTQVFGQLLRQCGSRRRRAACFAGHCCNCMCCWRRESARHGRARTMHCWFAPFNRQKSSRKETPTRMKGSIISERSASLLTVLCAAATLLASHLAPAPRAPGTRLPATARRPRMLPQHPLLQRLGCLPRGGDPQKQAACCWAAVSCQAWQACRAAQAQPGPPRRLSRWLTWDCRCRRADMAAACLPDTPQTAAAPASGSEDTSHEVRCAPRGARRLGERLVDLTGRR